MSDLSGFSMWELFRGEVTAQMQVLTSALLSAEVGAARTEALQAAMRAAHSIKGASRIVQFDLGVQLAHAMEDCLVAAQESVIELKPAAIDLLLSAGDLLATTALLEESAIDAWSNAESGNVAGLIAKLEDLRAGRLDVSSVELPHESAASAEQVDTPVASELAVSHTADTDNKPNQPDHAAQATKSCFGESADQAIKVASGGLNRIMGFAGDILVSGRRFEEFSQELALLVKRQRELSDVLMQLESALKTSNSPALMLMEVALQKQVQQREQLSRYYGELESYAARSQVTAEQLYYAVVATRMRPFGDLTVGLPRMVRDVARKLGKQVRLELIGQNTLVDREIQERLDAPLNHIVRNSLDHGLELPEQRSAAGKSPTGIVQVEARHVAGQFVVTISDDGAGIDLKRLREKIREKGLAPSELISDFNEEELLEFLFLPGFSTADEVTEISGRGVGLDAVQVMVKSVGGTVKLKSRYGLGSSMTIALPLTLSILRTLVAEVAGEPYAFPLTRIDKALHLDRQNLHTLEGHSYAVIDGEQVGVVSARALFDVDQDTPTGDDLSLILLGGKGERIALVVDRFLGEQELVVRPLDRRLGKLQDVSATALLEDGTPVLILDIEDLLLTMHAELKGGRLRGIKRMQNTVAGKKRILIAEDSITVRELERSMLSAHGYEVEVAVDGQDAWNALRSAHYDLLVTDVDMPRLTGFDLVLRVRADARLQSLPVIIVSYKDRDEDRLRGLEVGADRYITKNSFHDQAWITTVNELLEMGHA